MIELNKFSEQIEKIIAERDLPSNLVISSIRIYRDTKEVDLIVVDGRYMIVPKSKEYGKWGG